MMTGDSIFIDTNVLLRALHEELPQHRECSEIIISAINNHTQLWISRQIIREYLVQVTRPGLFIQPFTAKEAALKVRGFTDVFQIADETQAVTERLLSLIEEIPSGGKQIHDTNIVATMLVHNIQHLATLSVEDFRQFGMFIRLSVPE